jgi:hypothetical protein
MNPKEFLQLSRTINRIQLPTDLHRDLLEFSAARYAFFYDSSPRKHNCTYCRLTLKNHAQEVPDLIRFLTMLETTLQQAQEIPVVATNLQHVVHALQELQKND